MSSPRIVVAGEALVDLVQGQDWTYTAHAGGSPANVAVGLARLGVPVQLLARLSGDGFGRRLREHLTAAGVDLSAAVEAPEQTSLAIASLSDSGVATYDFRIDGTADWQWRDEELPAHLPDSVRALHTGSMALEVEPGASTLRALLQREASRVLVSYDPNVRLAVHGDPDAARAAVEAVVALATVVKVSAEDLAFLLPGVGLQDAVLRWRALGPALVVATDGGEGAVAALSGGVAAGVVAVPSEAVRVVDTVGAGDAYSAGLLAALDDRDLLDRTALERLDLDGLTAVMARAAHVAALTCARPGADPPTRAEADAG